MSTNDDAGHDGGSSLLPGEHARLVAALAESEARYRAVVTSLDEGITVHDAEGRILAANPSAAIILGVPAEALVGQRLTDPAWAVVDERGQPIQPEQHPVSVTLATGDASPIGLLGVHDRAGELHWLQLTVSPVTMGGPERSPSVTLGDPERVPQTPPVLDESSPSDGHAGEHGRARAVCSFTDVTFARHEEEQRQRTEHNFRTLIELTPDAVAVYQNDVISYANPRMVRLLGYDRAQDLLGRHPLDIVFPDDRSLVDRRMRTFAARGMEGPAAEERFRRVDGSPVPVEVTTIPIFYDGAPATLVHARDLSDRKRLEAQVVMADRLASVGRLAAAVGHEINNPLAYVMANLDLALERLAEPDVSAPDRLADIVEMLREAREGADRVRHIVRDLKVFSRGETEERTAVDPRRVLDSCVNMARGEIRQRARLVKRYGHTPPVLANEARLGQVILNLLVNAAHAIPEGEPETHEIAVATLCDDDGRVVIEVRDTGAGIPEDVKRRIFEPFFTTKGPGRGSGLGLSICQSIVTALGGEITFESRLGEGSAFRVILPAAPADAPADSPPHE